MEKSVHLQIQIIGFKEFRNLGKDERTRTQVRRITMMNEGVQYRRGIAYEDNLSES